MKYKCVKAFTLDTYDGDGFYVDGSLTQRPSRKHRVQKSGVQCMPPPEMYKKRMTYS